MLISSMLTDVQGSRLAKMARYGGYRSICWMGGREAFGSNFATRENHRSFGLIEVCRFQCIRNTIMSDCTVLCRFIKK
jgi:hypothetical protein